MSLATLLTALEPGVKKSPTGWLARCPAHDDRNASLTIGEGQDGRALVHCHAGCDAETIVARLSMTLADLYPERNTDGDRGPGGLGRIIAEYDYRDEKGILLYQAVRFHPVGQPKTFRQRKPAGPGGGWIWKTGDRLVLYRLPQLIAAPAGSMVYLVEGEKDANRLADLGLIVTTNVGGAGKWLSEYSRFLRGHHAVIIADNDAPGETHATQVQKAITGIACSVTILRLPGLGPKGDVSDWLDAGNAVSTLTGMVEFDRDEPELEPPASASAFMPSPERIRGERNERIQIGATSLSFGVNYLDHALGGITPTDLILLGAKTGVGKTSLATIIALHNSQRGKRVHYFALEAEDREIERRMKFQLIAAEYYCTGFARPPIRYLDWYMGRLDRELGYFEEKADQQLSSVIGNLHTFYRHDSFTTYDFCTQLQAIKNETDLVILDHLHYVDSDDDNENRAYKRTVQQIRDAAINAGKPVIVVAHVRKGDRRFEPLLPAIEDFHGSSDVPKIATKAVMLAGAFGIPNPQPYLWNTYLQILKCRLDGALNRYAAVVQYDTRLNCYKENYLLGRLADGGKTWTPLTGDEMPHWASPPPT